MEDNKVKIDLAHAAVKEIPKIPVKPAANVPTNTEKSTEKLLAITQQLRKKAIELATPYVVKIKKKIGERLIEFGQKLSK
jgi:hypothetical protein